MKEIHTHRKIKSDSRGSVVELLRREEVQEKDFGQIYITTALPGASKGNHFHKDKHEWISVLRGSGLISLKDIEEEGKPRVFRVYGEKPSTVYIPPYMAHAIINNSKVELIAVIYSTQPYNEETPDSYPLKITD